MATKTAFLMSVKGANIFIDGKTYVFSPNHPNFEKALQAVRNKEWDSIPDLVDIPSLINRLSVGNFSVKDGVLFHHGEPVESSFMVEKLLIMIEQGMDYVPLALFADNLLQNPSRQAIQELYEFLDVSNLPITSDGHFLAYKCIKDNWTDFHTGKVDNSIGTTVSMPRHKVNDDRTETCSYGLHVCSKEYLSSLKGYFSSFGGARLVVVKVNPRDVVSIPTDYNNSKLRCCEYTVIEEIEEEYIDEFEDVSVYAIDDYDDYDDEIDEVIKDIDDLPEAPKKALFKRLREYFPNL